MSQPGASEDLPVNRHRHVVRQRQVEHHAVASAILRYVSNAACCGLARRTQPDLLPVKCDGAGIRGRDTEQNARQFGPASAHEPGQPKNLSRAYFERDVIYA